MSTFVSPNSKLSTLVKRVASRSGESVKRIEVLAGLHKTRQSNLTTPENPYAEFVAKKTTKPARK